mgnify:CR=1 FL=1
MLEVFDDLFNMTETFSAICVTTNGIVRNGKAVMGAGSAKACAERWPETPKILGDLLTDTGLNVPYQLGIITTDNGLETSIYEENDKSLCRLFSFPTKDHFKDKSTIDLIRQSCHYMNQYARMLQMKYIAIPRPGCGARTGGLDWKRQVKPILTELLDDRFYICHVEGK